MRPGEAEGYVHGTALVFGETGLLIEGPSGSGKSTLAAALLTQASRFGQFARLIGDDRVHLCARHGRLVARPHPAVAGLIERRGWGLVRVEHEPACVIALVVAFAETDRGERHHETPPTRRLCGLELPLLTLWPSGGTENSGRVIAALTLA